MAGGEGGWSVGQVLRADLVDQAGELLDDILVTVHRPPPDWHLRLHLHGNPFIVQRCRNLLETCDLRALPDSESWRTGLWPATDLLAAEAYARLPEMLTARGAHWLLAQVERLRLLVRDLQNLPPGDQVQRICQEAAARVHVIDWFSRPVRVAIVGPPNAGKSTLINALADHPVSIVSPIPGTTRDWVEVPGEADGYPVVWLDTAGLREATDALEHAGMRQTIRVLRQADAVVVVLDVHDTGPATSEFVRCFGEHAVTAVAVNKCDLGGSAERVLSVVPEAWRQRAVKVSALQRLGLEQLCGVMWDSLGRSAALLELPSAFTSRQVAILLADGARDPKFVQDQMLHSRA